MSEAKSLQNRKFGSTNRRSLQYMPVSQDRVVHPDAESEYVREELLRIATLADTGIRTEARAACAELLFDFQPVIAVDSQLTALCVNVLRRCEATALQQRFLTAVYGESPTIANPVPRVVSPARSYAPRLARGTTERQAAKPVPVAEMAKQ
jgi:hypothetical protein